MTRTSTRITNLSESDSGVASLSFGDMERHIWSIRVDLVLASLRGGAVLPDICTCRGRHCEQMTIIPVISEVKIRSRVYDAASGKEKGEREVWKSREGDSEVGRIRCETGYSTQSSS